MHPEQTEQMVFEVLALAHDPKRKLQMKKSCLSSAVKKTKKKNSINLTLKTHRDTEFHKDVFLMSAW